MMRLSPLCSGLMVISGLVLLGSTALASEEAIPGMGGPIPSELRLWPGGAVEGAAVDYPLLDPSLSPERLAPGLFDTPEFTKDPEGPIQAAPIQGLAAEREGKISVGGAFMLYHYTGDDFTLASIMVFLSAGYYPAPEHEVGVDVVMGYNKSDFEFESQSGTSLQFLGKYNYHFIVSPEVSPYVGPHLGLAYFRDGGSETGFNIGFQLGVHYFVSAVAALKAEYRFSYIAIDPEDLIENYIAVGIDIFLDLPSSGEGPKN